MCEIHRFRELFWLFVMSSSAITRSVISRPTDWYSIIVPEGSKIARSLHRCQRMLAIRHDDPVFNHIDRVIRG